MQDEETFKGIRFKHTILITFYPSRNHYMIESQTCGVGWMEEEREDGRLQKLVSAQFNVNCQRR